MQYKYADIAEIEKDLNSRALKAYRTGNGSAGLMPASGAELAYAGLGGAGGALTAWLLSKLLRPKAKGWEKLLWMLGGAAGGAALPNLYMSRAKATTEGMEGASRLEELRATEKLDEWKRNTPEGRKYQDVVRYLNSTAGTVNSGGKYILDSTAMRLLADAAFAAGGARMDPTKTLGGKIVDRLNNVPKANPTVSLGRNLDSILDMPTMSGDVPIRKVVMLMPATETADGLGQVTIRARNGQTVSFTGRMENGKLKAVDSVNVKGRFGGTDATYKVRNASTSPGKSGLKSLKIEDYERIGQRNSATNEGVKRGLQAGIGAGVAELLRQVGRAVFDHYQGQHNYAPPVVEGMAQAFTGNR